MKEPVMKASHFITTMKVDREGFMLSMANMWENGQRQRSLEKLESYFSRRAKISMTCH